MTERGAVGEAHMFARALQESPRYRVAGWTEYSHLIPDKSGVYKFADECGQRVYVGEAENLRKRLKHQIMPSRRGRPWTLDEPPPSAVCAARNLLGNILKDQRDGRPLTKPGSVNIDARDVQTIDALNRAFRRIDELDIQWVECPDNLRKRVEHLAGRCIFDQACRAEAMV